jgi:hypothetical protein
MGRDSWTDDNHVSFLQSLDIVPSQFNLGTSFSQVGSTSCNLGFNAQIRDIDISSLIEGQSSCGKTAYSEANDSYM